MASVIEQLKAVARTARAPVSRADCRLLAETGLPVVRQAPLDPIQAAVQTQLLPLASAAAATGDYSDLAAAFDRLFARKAYCGHGYRTYRVAQDLLLDGVDGGCEPSQSHYGQWWGRNRSDPVAAAVYSHVLVIDAFARLDRDRDVTGDTRYDRTMQDTCAKARSVLAHAGTLGRRHWLWRHADYMLIFAASTVGVEDVNVLPRAFSALQALDPHEFGIYDNRAWHLLPKAGSSLGVLDKFARAAADRTRAQFGQLLYARIYDTVLRDEDPGATLVDRTRLMAAFADWYERFPSQALANRYAAYAHAFGDLTTLEGLFRSTVTELHPAHWLTPEQPLEAWRSVSRKRRPA